MVFLDQSILLIDCILRVWEENHKCWKIIWNLKKVMAKIQNIYIAFWLRLYVYSMIICISHCQKHKSTAELLGNTRSSSIEPHLSLSDFYIFLKNLIEFFSRTAYKSIVTSTKLSLTDSEIRQWNSWIRELSTCEHCLRVSGDCIENSWRYTFIVKTMILTCSKLS